MELDKSTSPKRNLEHGFSLVELMVALLIGTVVVFAIFTAFERQHKVQLAQNEVVETQQNIRASIELVMRDIRMAGFDPTRNASAGITIATAGELIITKDITDVAGTGSPDGAINTTATGETIGFGFVGTVDPDRNGIPEDADGDGNPDAASFGRKVGVGAGIGYQPIADNIQAFEFRYLDGNNVPTATTTDIRSIEVTILARAGKPDYTFTNTRSYTSASGAVWGPYGDNFRRRILTTIINCRNMGL